PPQRRRVRAPHPGPPIVEPSQRTPLRLLLLLVPGEAVVGVVEPGEPSIDLVELPLQLRDPNLLVHECSIADEVGPLQRERLCLRLLDPEPGLLHLRRAPIELLLRRGRLLRRLALP